MREGSADRTRLILERAPDAYVAIDASSVITDWNARASELFGWSRDEAVGRPLAETLIPTDQHAAHHAGLAEFLRSGHGPILGKTVELLALHRDGHRIPVELAVGVVDDEDGPSFYAFIRDITRR